MAGLFAAAALLAACGGGGGDAPPGSGSGPGAGSGGDPTVPAGEWPRQFVAGGNLVTSVPAATYAAGSEELAAYTFLNSQRSVCGFGLLRHSSLIDNAARAHADWQLVNNYLSHFEVEGTPGFTGMTSDDRIAATGYGSVGSISTTDKISNLSGANTKTGLGVVTSKGLLAAPYHALGMLGGFRDVGLAVRNDVDAGSTHGERVVAQYNLAHTWADGPQEIPLGGISTYPCSGASGVDYRLMNETPSPTPGRNLATNPIGHPVMFIGNPGVNLTVQSISINKVGSPAVALLPTVTNGSDPYGIVKPHQAFVMPDLPLDQNSSYNVTYTVKLRVFGYGQVLCANSEVAAQGFAWDGAGCSKTITNSFTFSTGTGG